MPKSPFSVKTQTKSNMYRHYALATLCDNGAAENGLFYSYFMQCIFLNLLLTCWHDEKDCRWCAFVKNSLVICLLFPYLAFILPLGFLFHKPCPCPVTREFPAKPSPMICIYCNLRYLLWISYTVHICRAKRWLFQQGIIWLTVL